MVPSEIWGSHANNSDEPAKVGCVYCLMENNVSAPLDIAYYWGGTSMCRKHLLEKVINVVHV